MKYGPNFVQSFACRTHQNYITILQKQKDESLRMQSDSAQEICEDEQQNFFEVTQLINSLFGLLIVPVEQYKAAHKQKTKEETRQVENKHEHFLAYFDNILKANKQPYEKIKKMICRLQKSERYRNTYYDSNRYFLMYPVADFLHHLRNALSHSGGGVSFYPAGKTECTDITSVFFCDHFSGESDATFCVHLYISEMEILINNLFEIYQDIYLPKEIKKQETMIQKCEEFLSNQCNKIF